MSRQSERMISPEQQQKLAQKYATQGLRRNFAEVGRVARNAGLAAIGVLAAQALHIPDITHQLPFVIPHTPEAIALINNVAQGLHTSLEVAGNIVVNHVPFADRIPNALVKAAEHTPFHSLMDRNLTADGEVLGGLAALNAARKAAVQEARNTEFNRQESEIEVTGRGREIMHQNLEGNTSLWNLSLGLTKPREKAQQAMHVNSTLLPNEARTIYRVDGDRKAADELVIKDALEGKVSSRDIHTRYSKTIAELQAQGISKRQATDIIRNNLMHIRRISHSVDLALVKLAKADKTHLNIFSTLTQLTGEGVEQAIRFGAAHGHTLLGAWLGIFFWVPAARHSYRVASEQGTPEKKTVPWRLLPLNFLPGVAAVTGALANIPAEISTHNFDGDVAARMMLDAAMSAQKPLSSRTPEDNFRLAIIRRAARKQEMKRILDNLGTIKRDLTNPLSRDEEAKLNMLQSTIQAKEQALAAYENAGLISHLLHPRKGRALRKDIMKRQTQVTTILPEKDVLAARINFLSQHIAQDQQTLEDFHTKGLRYRLTHPATSRKLQRSIEAMHTNMYSLMKKRYRIYDQTMQVLDAMNILKGAIGPIDESDVIPTPQGATGLKWLMEEML